MKNEYHGFVYEIKNNQAVIHECSRQDSVIEVPKTIEGAPVTVLSEYLFSGKDCETIILPKTVEKIGRYGFYNCRKLKSLSFGSGFTDIGSGAFTGCHHIEHLSVEMTGEEIGGLKEILSEIMEELRVELHGLCEAVLWFPEFYEEGVENTPARILMTQIHGSGLYYRNCFQGKQFNFMEYDRRFEMARAQESENFIGELVFGRLSKPWGLLEKAKEEYEDYLKAHYRALAVSFVKGKREEDLDWLLTNYPLSDQQKEDYQAILDAAAKTDNPSMMSMLMEYGRVHFPPKRRSFEL